MEAMEETGKEVQHWEVMEEMVVLVLQVEVEAPMMIMVMKAAMVEVVLQEEMVEKEQMDLLVQTVSL